MSIAPLSSVAAPPEAGAVQARPVAPADADRLCWMFHRLSAETWYRRFLTPASATEEPARRQAARLTDGASQLSALVVTDPADEQAIAVAELVRDDRQPAVAEAALVVADAYQGRGIGSALCAQLADQARTQGVTTIRALIQAQNEPVRRLLRRMGLPYTLEHAGGGMMAVAIELPA